jgi:hypothetical protein
MRNVKSCAAFLLLAVCFASPEALAIKVTTGPDFDLNINFLIQPRFQGDFDGVTPPATSIAPDGAAPNGKFNTDFYIKRARFVGRGTVYKLVYFLITLDTPNFGVRGNYGFNQNNSTFIQDAVIGIEPVKDFFIDFGFLLMPFSHGSTSNPGAQSAIDAPGSILVGRLMNNASRASREAGLQIRTLLLDHRLLLRGGVYEGARASQGIVPPPPPNEPVVNPSGRPLLAGMARWNIIGDEVGFPGFNGIYLDGKSRASIGVGGQWQGKGAVGGFVPGMTDYPDYLAVAADAFIDLALPGDSEVVLQINGYRFDYGTGNRRTGFGAAGDVGYRFGPIEPEANFYWFNADDRTQSLLKWAAGLNYFLKGHNAKLSAEFVGLIPGGNLSTTPTLHQVIVQGQLLF